MFSYLLRDLSLTGPQRLVQTDFLHCEMYKSNTINILYSLDKGAGNGIKELEQMLKSWKNEMLFSQIEQKRLR